MKQTTNLQSTYTYLLTNTIPTTGLILGFLDVGGSSKTVSGTIKNQFPAHECLHFLRRPPNSKKCVTKKINNYHYFMFPRFIYSYARKWNWLFLFFISYYCFLNNAIRLALFIKRRKNVSFVNISTQMLCLVKDVPMKTKWEAGIVSDLQVT